MKFILVVASILCASVAFAADAPPTVSLTKDQIARLIQAEQAKAIAGYIENEKGQAAKDVYDAINSAFAPKPASSEQK